MRILVVSAWDPTRVYDGSALVVRHHTRLLGRDHDIRLLTTDRQHPDATANLPFEVERMAVGGSAAIDFVGRRAWSWATGEPAHVRYVERPALLRRLADLRDSWRPDVAYLVGWGTARLWRVLAPVPCVHAAIDPWTLNFEVRPRGPLRRLVELGERRRALRHERMQYPNLAAVTLVSSDDAAWLADRVTARIEVIPNGVEAGPDRSPPPGERIVGFHGDLAATPNVDAARWCAEVLLPRLADQGGRLKIIGRNPPGWLVDRDDPALTVTGPVADVRAELDAVDVYVAPMTSGAGLKNKILEAMAAGRPVVTTPLGAQGIGAGNGVVVAPLDEIPSVVAGLLDDQDRADDLGRQARQRVTTTFTWERSAEALEAVLRSAAGT